MGRQAAQNKALYPNRHIEAKFSAKFLWIKKLKDPTNHHPWQVVACELFPNFGGDNYFTPT